MCFLGVPSTSRSIIFWRCVLISFFALFREVDMTKLYAMILPCSEQLAVYCRSCHDKSVVYPLLDKIPMSLKEYSFRLSFFQSLVRLDSNRIFLDPISISCNAINNNVLVSFRCTLCDAVIAG